MKPFHWLLLSLAIGITVALQLLDREHAAAHAWESIPLAFAAFGFVGCLLLIGIAKALGKFLIEKPEDHYDRDH
jgi:hypothetical protein